MRQSESLRHRTEQHKPKNEQSKLEDKKIAEATRRTIAYIEERFKDYMDGYTIKFEKNIAINDIIAFIKRKSKRTNFDYQYGMNKINPDGGIIYLIDKTNNTKLPLVISEVKRQGTNDKREAEGKSKQATGNAIERLGKNLTGIKALMCGEGIVPFVCFGQGCDFAPTSTTVLAKVSTLNEFYPLNKIYVHKLDGFSPVSMFFREEEWTADEMFEIMKEIAETSFRYYVF